MTTHLVTFSDESMSRARDLCIESAKANGISITHRYGPSDVSSLLRRHGIDPRARGCGYWAFKPAVILATMYNLGLVDTAFSLTEDNYIVWADAGVEFIAPISHVISRMDQDIFLFGNNWEHAHWCKGDVMYELWRDARAREGLPIPSRDHIPTGPDSRTYGSSTSDMEMLWPRFGKQAQASVIFFRVSDYTRKFVKEWRNWCLFEGGRLIDDSPSRLPNHPEFREHRHDQAILTTMAYREEIKLHYWPAVYNLGYPLPRGGFVYEKLACYASDDYPSPLFHHHRRRNHEWPA